MVGTGAEEGMDVMKERAMEEKPRWMRNQRRGASDGGGGGGSGSERGGYDDGGGRRCPRACVHTLMKLSTTTFKLNFSSFSSCCSVNSRVPL